MILPQLAVYMEENKIGSLSYTICKNKFQLYLLKLNTHLGVVLEIWGYFCLYQWLDLVGGGQECQNHTHWETLFERCKCSKQNKKPCQESERVHVESRSKEESNQG